MALSRRILVVASSAVLLLVIAISLSVTISVRTPIRNFFQASTAQAATIGKTDGPVGGKAQINGTDFDRVDVWDGSSIVPGSSIPPVMTATEEGLLGTVATPQSSAAWTAEGVIGPIATATPTPPAAPQAPPPQPQFPIIALSYDGSGGPKHCRGSLLQKMRFPPPLSTWKTGKCINLPSQARCGLFISSKGDNCEAQLFNMPDCLNTTKTYVNTVVFMPEERPVGALWRSMFVKCGVEVPEAKMLDPGILGDKLKSKPKPGGG
jgi:hypothetical protein